jgi:hypothetical protein
MTITDKELALIGQFCTLAAAVLAYLKGKENSAKIAEVHLSINSRMDELVAATRSAAHAEGITEGQANPPDPLLLVQRLAALEQQVRAEPVPEIGTGTPVGVSGSLTLTPLEPPPEQGP